MKILFMALVLPDILISKREEKIETPGQWESNRRPEILEMYKKYIYGEMIMELK